MSALIIASRKSAPFQSQGLKPLPLIEFDLSMTNQHLCPCCSYVLLRHIRHGNVYWRCSHCYESMPAWDYGLNRTKKLVIGKGERPFALTRRLQSYLILIP